MTEKTAQLLWVVAGILAANIFGAVVSFLYFILITSSSPAHPWLGGVLVIGIWPSLILVPMAMGIVAAYFWRRISPSVRAYLLLWSLTSLVVPLAAYVFMKEGLVCLLIGFPILFVGGFAGVMLGRIWFRSATKMNLSIVPLLFLAVLAEGKLRQDRQAVVTNRVLIRAPVAEVWKHVIAFPPVATAPDYWLNKVGLPSPIATTCEGPFVGADRRCIFSGGLVFKETVSELVPERILTFDIIEQPPDPELLGHLTLHRGQFELVDNGDSTTTLIGRSWYTLHMRPVWYFDWWTRDVTSHVHLRVMEHIRKLSENSR
jgi:hypothetical protein